MINLEHELINTYTNRQIDENHQIIEWLVPDRLTYFEGHFPGQPVLPAVALIDISEFFIRKTMTANAVLSAVPLAKIKAAISKNDKVQVSLKKNSNSKEYLCQWSFFEAPEKIITEIRLIA